MSCIVCGPRGSPASGFGTTHGARLMDSAPPARYRSPSPRRSAREAWFTASRPEAQSRFTVTPGTSTGQAGQERRHPSGVAVVLARLVGGAQVDVADGGRVDAGSLHRRGDHVGGEVVRPHPGERAAVTPHRRAHGVDDRKRLWLFAGLHGLHSPNPGMVGFIVLVLVLLARAYPGSGADLVDWRPTRSYEDEARLETEDIQQMIEAQNEMRRRRGKRELTRADASRMAREDQAVRERQRRSYDDRLDELEDELGV